MMRESNHPIFGNRLPDTKLIGVGMVLLGALFVLSGCTEHSWASGAPLPMAVTTVTLNAPAVSEKAVQTTVTPIPTEWTFGQGIIVEKTVDLTPTPGITETVDANLFDDGIPERVLLNDVPIGKQTRPLNCEFQSASDLLWHYGYPYAWDEIFELVGHDPGGNPHKGFVGRSFDDPPGRLYPNGYGVYAEPIAQGLAKAGIRAEVHYDEDVAWLKEQIRQGDPVMIWATADMIERSPEYWTAKDGQRIKAVRGEHTYLVVGYDEKGVWVADPWMGQRRHFSWTRFLASWSILDRMSLVILGPETPEP